MSLDDALREIVRQEVRAALLELAQSAPKKPPTTALTLGEAAREAQVSERTLRRAIADGKLRSVRWGRAVRIPRGALDEYQAGAA